MLKPEFRTSSLIPEPVFFPSHHHARRPFGKLKASFSNWWNSWEALFDWKVFSVPLPQRAIGVRLIWAVFSPGKSLNLHASSSLYGSDKICSTSEGGMMVEGGERCENSAK